MNKFESKHKDKISATLTSFDRIIFQGNILPLCRPEGVMNFLGRYHILIMDTAGLAENWIDTA